MSRIGNEPIIIPEGVTVSKQDDIVMVKGKLGEMKQKINQLIKIDILPDSIVLTRSENDKEARSLHGTYRSLIFNMVHGVSQGFEKKLELRGVGYRASNQGNKLDISVGYSHNIIFNITDEVKVNTESEKGQPPIITISGCDKQLVGAIAAKIRAERKPEPYKGKGIRYVDEYVRKKAGKTAAK